MSMFTKRHYEFLTEELHAIIATARNAKGEPFASVLIIDFVIEPLADALQRESPIGFDRQRFMAAILRRDAPTKIAS